MLRQRPREAIRARPIRAHGGPQGPAHKGLGACKGPGEPRRAPPARTQRGPPGPGPQRPKGGPSGPGPQRPKGPQGPGPQWPNDAHKGSAQEGPGGAASARPRKEAQDPPSVPSAPPPPPPPRTLAMRPFHTIRRRLPQLRPQLFPPSQQQGSTTVPPEKEIHSCALARMDSSPADFDKINKEIGDTATG